MNFDGFVLRILFIVAIIDLFCGRPRGRIFEHLSNFLCFIMKSEASIFHGFIFTVLISRTTCSFFSSFSGSFTIGVVFHYRGLNVGAWMASNPVNFY